MSEKNQTESESAKRGRPAKNYADLHVQIPQDAKEEIEKLAEAFNVSQGELIAVAVRGWKQAILLRKS